MLIRTLVLPGALLFALVAPSVQAVDTADSSTPKSISLDAAKDRATDLAKEMDANGDGVIDADELAAFQERRRAERLQSRLAHLDTDGDGVVTVTEFVNARTARLSALDTDGDGIISAEEFRQGRGHMQRRGKRHHSFRGDGSRFDWARGTDKSVDL